MRSLFIIICVAMLSACAIKPRHYTASCAFKHYVIDVQTPESGGGETVEAAALTRIPSDQPIIKALRAAGTVGAASDGRPVDPSMLFLSGGSQHGAFGAGFLEGWKERDKNLPKFAVVTGVSTGSILSTFAFINEPEKIAAAYAITHESQLLEPLVPVKNGSPTTFGYVGVVQKGAIADLGPLRTYLHKVLTDDILSRVAQGEREQRLLRVGVVDVDTGQAVALDLADMANRWAQVAPDNTAERGRLKDCYVEAIVASSSAPLAARPVFIDERMYIDGGARFGAFSNEFENVLSAAKKDTKLQQPAVYLLMNGDQRLASRCARKDETLCVPPRTAQNRGKPLADPPSLNIGAHAKWSFLKLALRSEQILANQVYRFSADSIANLARRDGMKLYYTQIDADMMSHRFKLSDPNLGTGEMSCAKAYETDKDALDPVQFYPRYMRCLLDYGHTRGAGSWTSE